jgi:3-oxoacyl-(acyl-carrier-protein) synthase
MDASGFRVGAGGEVDEAAFDEDVNIEGPCLAFARRACREVIEDAGLTADLPADTPLAFGSGAGEMRAMERAMGLPESSLLYELADPVQTPNIITTKLAYDLGLRGRLLTFINAPPALRR